MQDNLPQKNSIIFYRSFYESIKALPKKNQLELFLAITEYGLNFIEPQLSGVSLAVWIGIRPQLDANRKKWENGLKGAEHGHKGSEYGNSGGRPKQETPQATPQNGSDNPPKEEGVRNNEKEEGVRNNEKGNQPPNPQIEETLFQGKTCYSHSEIEWLPISKEEHQSIVDEIIVGSKKHRVTIEEVFNEAIALEKHNVISPEMWHREATILIITYVLKRKYPESNKKPSPINTPTKYKNLLDDLRKQGNLVVAIRNAISGNWQSIPLVEGEDQKQKNFIRETKLQKEKSESSKDDKTVSDEEYKKMFQEALDRRPDVKKSLEEHRNKSHGCSDVDVMMGIISGNIQVDDLNNGDET